MSIATFAELKTAVAATLIRTDQTANIINDIALCEAQINRTLRIRQMIGRSTTTIDGEYVALPSDFAGPRSIRLTGTTPITTLEYTSPEQMADLKAYWLGTSSTPTTYTVVGSEFEFGPTPSADVAAALTYYKRVPALSDAATTNWLLTAHPDIYLYGSCLQSCIRLQDDDAARKYAALFTQAIEAAKAADVAESQGALLRVGSPFAP